MLVDTTRSSLTLVAPFLFPTEATEAIVARVTAASAAGRNGAIPVWQVARVETDEWLPHIARSLEPAAPAESRIAYFWEVTPPFARANSGLSVKTPFEFVLDVKSGRSVKLHLAALQLIVFRDGSGFVVLRWRVDSDSPTDWLDVQERFQTHELYREVCTEVREMSEYLRDQDKLAREQRVSLLTLLLTVLIGAPTTAIGFWNINIVGYTSQEGLSMANALGNVAGAAGVIGLVFAMVWAVVRRR